MTELADSIANVLTGIGSKADPTNAVKPTVDGRLNRADIDALYLRNDLARRIVEELPLDSLRSGLPQLVYEDTGEPVKLEYEEEQWITNLLSEASTTARLYGGAHIMLVFEEGSTDTPLPDEYTDMPELVNAVVVDRYEASPFEYNNDPNSHRFTEPDVYWVTIEQAGAVTTPNVPVHYTRLLSFHGARLPRRLRNRQDTYHDSILQQVWESVLNFTQSEKAIVNLISRYELATISIKGLSQKLSTPEGGKYIQDRMNWMTKSMSILNAALVDADEGEAYTRAFANVSGLDALWDRLAGSVVKAANMSMTQLFGESASGIRGDDEAGAKKWRKQVDEYRSKDLMPAIVRLVSIMKQRPVAPVKNRDGRHAWGPSESNKPVDQARIDEFQTKRVTPLIEKYVINTDEARQLLAGREIDWDKPAPTPPTQAITTEVSLGENKTEDI